MEDLVSKKCGAGHCAGQKIVGIEQLEPNGRSQREQMPGVSKLALTKKPRQEQWTLKWDWQEDLYFSQEKKMQACSLEL